jgi:hypothetical protein
MSDIHFYILVMTVGLICWLMGIDRSTWGSPGPWKFHPYAILIGAYALARVAGF